jgi:two-component system, NarL family, sensor histidine kinase DesK
VYSIDTVSKVEKACSSFPINKGERLMEPIDGLYQEEKTEGISWYLLWAIWLMWLPFLIQPASDFLQMPLSLQKGAVGVGFALFVSTYLWATWHEAYRLTHTLPMDVSSQKKWWWVPIALLAGLSIVLLFLQGSWGLGGFIFTSASVAGRLTPRQAAMVFGGLMLLVLLLGVLTATPWPMLLLMIFLVPAVGATVSAFSRTIWTNRELRLARRQIAHLAISEERLRFARDLHDLLGHTLSLITLKSELAGQLIPEDPEQAQREVWDIETAARTALREVREAVVGYRQSTLVSELQRAHELLTAAGIQDIVQNDTGVLPVPIEALLTWVVREGVTNVMRHSRAKHCIISLAQPPGEISLTIIDDGQGCTSGERLKDSPGNGLRGIIERVAALHGHYEAEPAAECGFRLAVSLPLQQESAKRHVMMPPEQGRGDMS